MRQPAYLITEVDEAILRALARFHYLTAAQASRLLYPNLSDDNRYMQRRLKKLTDGEYVLRLRALPVPQYGQAPHVFTLGRRGRQYTTAAGVARRSYFRPSEEKRAAHNSPFMVHRLATIDVMIAAVSLCRDLPVICPQLLSERELKRGAVHVDVPPGPHGTIGAPKSVAVIPDAWFQLTVAGAAPISIAVELDRATEDQKVWREKVAAYAYWAEGPYQEAFETDNLTIAVVCPSNTRVSVLADWTMRELRTRNLAHLGDIFLLAAASPVGSTPERFFFDPVWRSANQPSATSLLEAPAAIRDESGVVFRTV
jgi:hypothetical protein